MRKRTLIPPVFIIAGWIAYATHYSEVAMALFAVAVVVAVANLLWASREGERE
jgi:hypothetical protein